MRYPMPTIVCRCGRVFRDGEDVWPHVREEWRREKKAAEVAQLMQAKRDALIALWPPKGDA